MFSHLNDREKRPMQFFGNYRGVVVDDQDPLKNGRVRIRVFSVYDDIPDLHIPWAEYVDPMMGSSINVPVIGTIVWVFFDNGDHRKPVYFGAAPSMKNNGEEHGTPDESREESSDYPKNRVYKSESGITIEIDDTEGNTRYKVSHPSGSSFELTDDGRFETTIPDGYSLNVEGDGEINAGGSLTINVGGDAAIDAGGNVTISSGGNVEISGSMITLN